MASIEASPLVELLASTLADPSVAAANVAHSNAAAAHVGVKSSTSAPPATAIAAAEDGTDTDEYRKIFEARGHLYNAATSRCPAAREAERAALLDLLNDVFAERAAAAVAAASPALLVDVPAGGGYLAEGARARWGDAAVRVLCVEPSPRFAAVIDPAFEVRHDAMAHMASVRTGAVDVVASLAGLHHVDSRTAVFAEWLRVLRAGGVAVAADVQPGTRTADFLNTFVDQYTPGGHAGVFFAPGDFTRDLRAVGFVDVHEELRDVAWRFPDEATMVAFCHSLFGLSKADEATVAAGLREYFALRTDPADGSVCIPWQLRYVRARKPDADATPCA